MHEIHNNILLIFSSQILLKPVLFFEESGLFANTLKNCSKMHDYCSKRTYLKQELCYLTNNFSFLNNNCSLLKIFLEWRLRQFQSDVRCLRFKLYIETPILYIVFYLSFQELSVTDDTVLEAHNEDPALVQMKLIGDGGRTTFL